MKTTYVTWAVIDQCLIDDGEELEADPDEFASQAVAEREAKAMATECGGSFRVMKITREILPARVAAAKARGDR